MLSSPNAHQSMMSNPMMMNGPRMNGPMGSPMPPHMMSSPNGPMHPIAGLNEFHLIVYINPVFLFFYLNN